MMKKTALKICMKQLMPLIDFILNNFTPFGCTEPRVKTSEPLKPVHVVQRGSVQVPQLLKVGHNVETGESFTIELKDYEDSGERDAILASSGMGKSYLARVLLEENLETKGIVCIIDAEGEWYSLAQKYPFLIAGGDNANVTFEYFEDSESDYPYATMEKQASAIISTVLNKGISVVFDFSHMDDDESRIAFAIVSEALFEKEGEVKDKILFFLDEAQIFPPQNSEKQKKGAPSNMRLCNHIAKRGRKRAINSIWATQRPASLNKNILSQCNRFWFGGLQSKLDFTAIKPYLEQAGITQDQVMSIQHKFYFYSSVLKKDENGLGKISPVKLVKARKPYTKHIGKTPKRNLNARRATKEDLQGILDGLK